MKIIKKVIAPVRIDFGGGTTDVYPFTKLGGVVLNAAINRYIVGELISTPKNVSLQYSGNIPTSSGLGTSGVMTLVWLSLISNEKNKIKLAEKVYDLEQAMGQIGGKQDQYASALGGFNYLEFKNDKVKAQRLNLSGKLIRHLEKHLALIYTGKHPNESNKLMMNNLMKGKTKQNLLQIRDIAKDMKKALLKQDLVSFADLMNQETEQRRRLHSSIIPPRVDKIIKKAYKHGAISAKVCGAGGGGSLLFFGDKKKLKKKFKKSIIDFKFDFKGLRVY